MRQTSETDASSDLLGNYFSNHATLLQGVKPEGGNGKRRTGRSPSSSFPSHAARSRSLLQSARANDGEKRGQQGQNIFSFPPIPSNLPSPSLALSLSRALALSHSRVLSPSLPVRRSKREGRDDPRGCREVAAVVPP